MKLNWNFKGGLKRKEPSTGGTWIFSERTQSKTAKKKKHHQMRDKYYFCKNDKKTHPQSILVNHGIMAGIQ